jgi:protein-disulfide isomerase
VSKKAWIIFASVCFALLVVLVYISSKDKVDVNGVNLNAIQAASQQSGNIADHVFGKKDSKVLFVEYGDYQCPGCGNAYPNVKTVTDKYQGQIAFVFRNFPLTTLHPNAEAAAAAAEAAGLQGKYWEMHDKLYENQSSWENLSVTDRANFFEAFAKDLGLNATQFMNDMGGQKVTQKISFDIALGQKANISATPSFFLDGKALDSNTWGTAATLDAAIAQELKANNIALPAATN